MKLTHMALIALIILIATFIVSVRMTSKELNTSGPTGALATKYSLTDTEKAEIASYADIIVLESPQPLQEVTLPFQVTGKARGYWFFEASFPIMLVDENDNIIARSIGQSTGDWMTTDFIGFTSTLASTTLATSSASSSTLTKAYIMLAKDNPSGDAANDRTLRIPVLLRK